MNVLGRRRRAPAPALTLALALGLAVAAPAAAAEVTFDSGHVDVFDVAYENGRLHLHMAETITSPPTHTERDPADVVLRVKPEAAVTVPSPPGNLSFLGPGGNTVYLLPIAQNPDLLWPGIATEEVPAGVFANPLRIEVVDVAGPGQVSLWQVDSFGNPRSVLAGGGYALPGAAVPPGYPSGDGLAVPRTLATAAAGSGTGTSTLDADLLLYAPTDLALGTYEGLITFTAI
jgi:hypothetical protein